MVLRDFQGSYISGKILRFAGAVQLIEAEMVGILEALSWLEEAPVGDAEVRIESDSLLSFNAVSNKQVNFLELGTLVQHYRALVHRDFVGVC